MSRAERTPEQKMEAGMKIVTVYVPNGDALSLHEDKEADQSRQWSAQTMLEFVMTHLPAAQFAEFVRLVNEADEEFWRNAEMNTGGWKTGGSE